MKNIKKIMFAFIIIMTVFSCKMNVLGDTTCRYKIEYPFDGASITKYDEYNSLYIDNNFLKYIYIVQLGKSQSDFLNFINEQEKEWIQKGYITYSISAMINLNTNKITIDIDNTGVNREWENKELDLYVTPDTPILNSTCPDIITLSVPNFKHYSDNQRTALVKAYYTNDFITPTFRDAVSFFENWHTPMILLPRDNSETRLKMATIFPYMGYYTRDFTHITDKNDVDPIINKYLALEGWTEVLDEINQSLDSNGTIGNDLYKKIKNTILEQLLNNNLSFDTIDNDISVLKNFAYYSINDDSEADIFTEMKNYLNKYNMTITDWYKTYMSGSKTNYVRSLLIMLPIYNDEEIKTAIEKQKKYNDASDKYKTCINKYQNDEVKAKEECLEECLKFAEAECSGTSSQTGCMSTSSMSCKTGNSKEIQSNMEEVSEDNRKTIEDLLEKKIVSLYKNQGIEIVDGKEFCNILIGKDNENGLYPYIKIVLNLIRIGGPILVIVLTGFDIMKVISSFKDDENKKFWNHLKIRIICLAVLILVPTIINFLVKLIISSSCSVKI